jgi:predicted RNase H-like HicB family nuclease
VNNQTLVTQLQTELDEGESEAIALALELVEIFQEENLFVGLSPELNISSFGETIEETQDSIKEAYLIFMQYNEIQSQKRGMKQ